jgi:RNA polymerase sigma factor (sigma-70 family)
MNALPVRLTVDEAWRRWREESSPLAREWLVVHYASLVKFVAGRLAAGLPRQVDTGDLASAGVFGLMGAIERYDPSHGAKFETYAIPRIRGAILDSLRSLDWVPRSVRSRTKSIETAINVLEHELGLSTNCRAGSPTPRRVRSVRSTMWWSTRSRRPHMGACNTPTTLAPLSPTPTCDEWCAARSGACLSASAP